MRRRSFDDKACKLNITAASWQFLINPSHFCRFFIFSNFSHLFPCRLQGPLAEERLMRLLAGRAAALGAHSLRCRARFTVPWLIPLGRARGKRGDKTRVRKESRVLCPCYTAIPCCIAGKVLWTCIQLETCLTSRQLEVEGKQFWSKDKANSKP